MYVYTETFVFYQTCFYCTRQSFIYHHHQRDITVIRTITIKTLTPPKPSPTSSDVYGVRGEFCGDDGRPGQQSQRGGKET